MKYLIFYERYIKDYDGGTQMECYIHPKIDYNNISSKLKQQKQVNILKRIY